MTGSTRWGVFGCASGRRDAEALAPEPIRDLLALKPEERNMTSRRKRCSIALSGMCTKEDAGSLFAKQGLRAPEEDAEASKRAQVRVVAESRFRPARRRSSTVGTSHKPTDVEVKPGGLAVLPPIEGRKEGSWTG